VIIIGVVERQLVVMTGGGWGDCVWRRRFVEERCVGLKRVRTQLCRSDHRSDFRPPPPPSVRGGERPRDETGWRAAARETTPTRLAQKARSSYQIKNEIRIKPPLVTHDAS